jgi:L-cysteine/cystine lyase
VDTIESIRERMPATRRNGYFNAGARGPLPQPVVDAWKGAIDEELTLGRQGPWFAAARKDASQATRAGFARALGVSSESIAIRTSTSEAMNLVLTSLRWRPGDEIVTTDSEFPSLNTALALVAKQHQVTVRVAEMPTRTGNLDAAQIAQRVIESFSGQMNGRTRLLAFSHVLYNSGLMVPLEALCRLAHAHNAQVLCDAAQSLGAVAIDVPRSEVDYYAFPGQKWLCGPEGIGGLYIRPDRLDDLDLVPTRTATEIDFAGRFEPRKGALRFESASFDYPRMRAMAAALDWFFAIGPDFIFERNHALAHRFVDGLQAVSGTTLISPPGFANLVGFRLAGWKDSEAVAALRDKGFLVRRVPGSILRFAFGYYNLEDEVDALLQVTADLARRPITV